VLPTLKNILIGAFVSSLNITGIGMEATLYSCAGLYCALLLLLVVTDTDDRTGTLLGTVPYVLLYDVLCVVRLPTANDRVYRTITIVGLRCIRILLPVTASV
jgi:hypothetical protein